MSLSIFEKFIDIYYVIDIIINFNLAYENSENKLIYDRK